MNYKLLRDYIARCPDYTFNIGFSIEVPKLLLTNKRGLINLGKERDRRLRYQSGYACNFKELIRKIQDCKELEYVMEVPVPIEDKLHWERLCARFEVNDELESTEYFMIDFLFPWVNIAVEIDSGYHRSRKIMIEQETSTF